MKICTKCFEEKAENEFFVRDKTTGRLHSQCKQCYKIHRVTYSAEHYRKYGDAYRLRAKQRRRTVQKELHNRMLSYLRDKKCSICSETDIRTFEFDHINPNEKSFNISRGMTNGYKWEMILQEINKCRILCANCHKKHTSVTRNWYKIVE